MALGKEPKRRAENDETAKWQAFATKRRPNFIALLLVMSPELSPGVEADAFLSMLSHLVRVLLQVTMWRKDQILAC